MTDKPRKKRAVAMVDGGLVATPEPVAAAPGRDSHEVADLKAQLAERDATIADLHRAIAALRR